MNNEMEICRAGNKESFDGLNSRLDKIETSMDKIEEAMTKMGHVLERQHISLVDHTRRSTASEGRLNIIERQQEMFLGFIKGIGILAVVIGASYTLIQMFKLL